METGISRAGKCAFGKTFPKRRASARLACFGGFREGRRPPFRAQRIAARGAAGRAQAPPGRLLPTAAAFLSAALYAVRPYRPPFFFRIFPGQSLRRSRPFALIEINGKRQFS